MKKRRVCGVFCYIEPCNVSQIHKRCNAMKLNIVITKGEKYLIGTIKEIPAVLTQGETIAEVKENIQDALALYLEDMRDEQISDAVIYQEELTF